MDDTFDDVKLVTADDYFLAFIQSVEGVEFGLDPRTDDVSGNTGRVDTDGAVIYGSDVTLDIDAFLVGAGLVTTDSDTGRDEMTLVGIGLEADKIRAEHAIQNFLST